MIIGFMIYCMLILIVAAALLFTGAVWMQNCYEMKLNDDEYEESTIEKVFNRLVSIVESL